MKNLYLLFILPFFITQLFAQNGNTSEQLIKGSWYDNDLGLAVAIEGNTALVGEPGAGGDYTYARPNSGRVKVYEYQNGSWNHSQTIASNDNSYYSAGSAVALDGNTAMVGVLNRGAVWVYTKSGGSWQFTQELVATDDPYLGFFGASIAISGNRAIIGAPRTTVNGSSLAGAAYIFEFTNGSWSQVEQLASNDLSSSDNFGLDVDISSSYAVATAPGNSFNSGSAYIFKFDDLTNAWEETNEIAGIGGDAVAIAADLELLAIGDKDKFHSSGNPVGTVYIYRVPSFGNTSLKATLLPNVPSETVAFGRDVSYANRQLLIGSYYDHNSSTGGAYLFKKALVGNSWDQVGNLKPELNENFTGFGKKVALSDEHALVGADDYANGLYGNSGAVYFYQAPFLAIGEPDQEDMCISYPAIDISSNTTASSWQPLLDNEGDLLAEIHANGQLIGTVIPTIYKDSNGTSLDAQGNALVRRHLEIDVENTFANPVSVRIYLLASELEDFLDANPDLAGIDDLQLAKVDASCAQQYQNNGTAIIPQLSKFGEHHVLTFSVSSFSTFYPVKPASILPVRLASFTARLTNGKKVQLNWSTETETNNEGFSIERSSDGKEFKAIGWVSGHGDTDEQQTYTFEDIPDFGGGVYYRLRQQDYDGAYSYSDIRSLSLPSKHGVITLRGGNPIRSGTLAFSALEGHRLHGWQLVSMTSKVVGEGLLTAEIIDYDIDVSSLPKGIYVLSLYSDTSDQFLAYKVVIEN